MPVDGWLEPSPAMASPDVLNYGRANSCAPTNIHVTSTIRYHRFNFGSDFVSYLGCCTFFSTVICAMNEFVRMILRSSFPRKMARIDASKMAIAARMSGIHVFPSGGAVHPLAGFAGNHNTYAINGCSPVSRISSVIRPNKTFGATELEDCFEEKLLHNTSVYPASQWVSVTLPPDPVLIAPTTSPRLNPASFNRAHSHLSPFLKARYRMMTCLAVTFNRMVICQ